MNRGAASEIILRSAIPGPQKLILSAYLCHQDSNVSPTVGTSWPSVDLMCTFTCNGTKTTAKHRDALVDAGILVVVRTRSCNVLECRIDFGTLQEAGQARRGRALAPGNRGGRFGKDCGSGSAKTADPPPASTAGSGRKDCGTAKTADPQRLPIRSGRDCGSGSAKTADEPSSRTFLKNLPQGERAAGAAPPPDGREVFEAWAARQPHPERCQLDPDTARLLRQALDRGYSIADLQHLVAFACDAPIGPGGLRSSQAEAWRGRSGQELPRLHTLLEPRRLANKVQAAREWQAPSAAPPPAPPAPPPCPLRAAVTELVMMRVLAGSPPPGGMHAIPAAIDQLSGALDGHEPQDVAAAARSIAATGWPSTEAVVAAVDAAATHRLGEGGEVVALVAR